VTAARTRSRSTAKRSTTRPASGKGRGSGRRPRGGRHGLRHLLQGERLYLLALVLVVTVVGAMALGPLQSYTAAADRVDALERTRDQLRSEVDALEERQERLQDPEELELLARSELGLVKPGEIPFVVVTPDDELVPVRPQADATAEGDGDEGGPWYRQLGRALADLFATDS
jgi:cell division protein FtsB